MGTKCTFEVPARIISDMDGDDGIFQKDFELEVIPAVGTIFNDPYLLKARCRNEDQPLIIEDVTFNTEDSSYLLRVSKITIDSNYLDRIDGWGDQYLSQWV